jgi:hypothetical protein
MGQTAGTIPPAPEDLNRVLLPRQSKSAGKFWKGVAIAVFAVGMIGPYFIRLPIPPLAVQFLSLMATILIYVFASKLLLRGRRLMASSAEEILARDTRPPVIYMRSFKDDQTAAQMIQPAAIGWAFLFGAIETEEELLAKTLNEFGPVITIGRPGEEMRELGAARTYSSEAEWHEKVESLMGSARLVVLRLGTTEGFWWELQQSIRKMNPHQLLVFVPYIKDRAARESVRKRAEEVFPKPLPEFTRSDKRAGTIGSLRGYLYFDPDWTPHYVDLTRKLWTFKTLPRFLGFAKARASLKYGLRPVFNQVGVPWIAPPVRKLSTFVFGAIFLALIALVLAAMIGILFFSH